MPKKIPRTARFASPAIIKGIDIVMLSCVRCSFPVIVEVARSAEEPAFSAPLQLREDFHANGYQVIKIYPTAARPEDLPDHVPDAIAAPYEQACRSLHVNDYDLAGMGFRKSLDVATKHAIRQYSPSTSADSVLKQSFQKRINFLHENQIITTDLRHWADLVRVEGNDAAHEEHPFTSDQAYQIHHFARVFLMYVFTMPKMVEIYRSAPTEVGETET
jgi:hypothetical protein